MDMDLANAQNLAALTLADIQSVYSGKAAKCRCGCAGTYSYTKHCAGVAEQRGGKVNEAQVKKVLQTLQARIDEVEYIDGIDGQDIYNLHVSEGRVYTVYTNEAR